MSIDPEAIDLAKRFEPILLFHPDENFFPIDPKFYLERCALWRSEPPSHDKKLIGASCRTPPSLANRSWPKAQLAALEDERDVPPGGKTWIGSTDANGKSSFLVVPEHGATAERGPLSATDGLGAVRVRAR